MKGIDLAGLEFIPHGFNTDDRKVRVAGKMHV